MKKVTRMIALMMCLTVLLGMLSGCGGGQQSASSDGAAASGAGSASHDTVTISIETEPTAIHPAFATSVVSNLVGIQMFETLINKVDGEFVPGLATDWEWADDNLSITFTLREGVKFHNGETMTAEDVAFTYNTAMATGYTESLCGFMDHMEVVDDTHVTLYLKEVYGAALESIVQATLGIFPKAYYESDPEGFSRNPVGTGPYKFSEWVSGASISLTAFDDYWGDQKATIPNVRFVLYNNAATSAALALENDEIDILTNVAATDVTRLENAQNVQVATTEGAAIAFVMFSMEDGSLFQDENLRLAIAHAINKEDVLLGAVEGMGTVANAIFPSYTFGVSGYEAPGYDPEQAKADLAAAGYPDGLSIDVIVNSNDTYYKPAEIVQAQLAEVGINLNMEKMESNAWFEDVWRAGDYGMSILLFSCAMPDVMYYYQMFTSDGNENFGHVVCPDLDEAYERARTITDLDERAQACYDVVKAFGDHAICVPIYCKDKIMAADADLNGFVAETNGYVYCSQLSWAE